MRHAVYEKLALTSPAALAAKSGQFACRLKAMEGFFFKKI
jgi:hypothetical protein